MRELDLLTALAERHDRIVSREELYAVVWEEQYRKSDRSVDVYIARLRRKLDEAIPGCAYIHTHFGFGYRLRGLAALHILFTRRHSRITDSFLPVRACGT